MATLTIQVNGEQRSLDAEPPTLDTVVQQLGHHPKFGGSGIQRIDPHP